MKIFNSRSLIKKNFLRQRFKHLSYIFFISFIYALAASHAIACTQEKFFNSKKNLPKIIVVADIPHGTNEIPAFTAGILCDLVSLGKPVILALEMSRAQQEPLNTYLESQGEPADRQTLLATRFWDNSSPDGRSSQAIFNLIDQVRILRKNGKRVAIAPIEHTEADVPLALYPEEDKWKMMWRHQRQISMAFNVQMRAAQYPDHTIVVLTAHASKTKGRRNDPEYKSLTYLLSKEIPLKVIGFQPAGGETWACRGPTAENIQCKTHVVRREDYIGLITVDRRIPIDKLTASVPAQKSKN